METPTFTEKQFWRAMLKEQFVLFALYGFGIREYCAANPADNWWSDDVHWDICLQLDKCVKEWERVRQTGIRKPMKVAVCIPRGWGKSTIGCALDLWIQLRNPNTSEIISSYDEDKAKEFLGVNIAVMEGESQYGWFKELYGSWKPSEGSSARWTKGEVTHNRRTNRALRDPSYTVASVATGITGGRPDVFRTDDLVVEEKLSKIGNWIERAKTHMDSAEYAVKTNGLFLAYYTRYREDDVGGKIMLSEGVKEFASFGMLPRSKDAYKMGGPWHVIFYSCEDETGTKSTFPEVWPWERLKEIEAKDPRGYACQMLNEPSAVSYMPLKQHHIDQLWVPRSQVPLKECVRVLNLDTAFKYEDQVNRGDYNVIVDWALDSRYGIAHFMNGFRNNEWNSKEFMDALITYLKQLHGEGQWPLMITDERAAGGQKEQAFEQFLLGECRANGLPSPNYLPLKRSGQRTQKDENRVRTAVYAWLSGKVRLVEGANEVQALVYEMLHIGTSAHDDMRDAAADVFNPLVYRPYSGAGGLLETDQPRNERPYDELLWIPTADLTDDDRRRIYDNHFDQELHEESETEWDANPWQQALTH